MSFTLGNKTAAQLNLIMLRDNDWQALPPTRERSIEIPGRSGRYYVGMDMGVRQFNLECEFYKAANRAALETHIRTLTDHLLDDQGRSKELTLKFDDDESREYKVRYIGTLNIRKLVNTGVFTIPLVAYDPYAYGSEVTIDLGNTGEEENEGDVTAYPFITVTFTNASETFKLEKSSGEEFISFSAVFEDGDELFIDCQNLLVSLNSDNVFDLIDPYSSFWGILPGEQINPVITPAGVATIEIKFRPRWL